ncbi:MAG: oligosaccharide flippase family protein, partial [Gemmatimonas sp.]
MSLKRSFVIYTASSIIGSALPLALLPLMTRYLSVEEYGIVATMTTLIAFFTPPLTWGVPGIVSVEHGRLDADTFRRFVATALSVPLVSLVLMIPVLQGLGWQSALGTASLISIMFLMIPSHVALNWDYVFNRT